MYKIIYCKYSKERARQFAIRTDIVEQDGQRFVRKVNVYPEGKDHIAHIYESYEKLQEQYGQVGLLFNHCRLLESGQGICLEYLNGNTLHQMIEGCIQGGQLKTAEDLFDEYLRRCFHALPTIAFQMTENFTEVFGRCNFGEDEPAISVADVDLICSNIIVNDQGWNVIDYEWTYLFPVPLKYIMYRCAFLTHHQMPRCEFLQLERLWDKLGLTAEDVKACEEMERHYQQYLRKGIPSNYDIQQRIGKKVITISEINQKMNEDTIRKNETEHLPLHATDMVKKIGKRIKRKIKNISGLGDIEYCIDDIRPLAGRQMLITGWGMEKDRRGTYQELEIQMTNQKGKTIPFTLTRDLRADVNALVCHDKKIEKQFGYSLIFEQELDEVYTLWLRGCGGVRREKVDPQKIREQWRRYKTQEDMETMADDMQRQEDAFYRKKYGQRSYRRLVEKRLSGKDVPYMAWRKYQLLDEKAKKLQMERQFPYMPKISILVPAYRTPREFLVQMLDSVEKQTYKNWELCIADASLNDSIRDILEEYHQRDGRIKYVLLEENAGISGNTNKAMEMAAGEYISLLDHDDILAEDALYEVVKCINEKQVDVLCTDEDKVSLELDYYFDPYCKPDFNRDLLLSCNYICHFFVVKKEIADQVGWFNSEFDGSQDYDFILRCTNAVKKVGHVQKAVYHWRCHPASTAMNPESKLYCYEAGKKALQKILDSQSISAAVNRMAFYGCYEIVYPLQGKPSVLALMLDGDKFQTDYRPVQVHELKDVNAENVYAKVRAALEEVDSDFVYLGQGSQNIETKQGMERLLANLQRNHVGAVGCKVISEDDKILEAGRTTALLPEYQNLYRGHGIQDGGYNMRNFLQQDVSALGWNGLVMERKLLQQVLEQLLQNDRSGQTISTVLADMKMRMIMVPMVVCRQMEPLYKAIKHDVSVSEPVKTDPYYSSQFNEKGKPYQFGW